ncbi:MAG: RCC1 domain-containing protein [Pseudomonadota bacterium]
MKCVRAFGFLMLMSAGVMAADLDNDGIADRADSLPFVPQEHLSLGHNHSCALIDSAVTCWGSNLFGQTAVPGILGATRQVVAADQNTCAMDANNVTCWGIDGFNLFPLNNGRQMSTGGLHVCVIDDEGLWCYRGGNKYGELEVPTNLENPRQVAVGLHHTCVLDDIGVHCWGRNAFGETEVPVLNDPRWISAGGNFTCALDGDRVVCWGLNNYGQLEAPTLVNPRYLEAGFSHACAIDDAGLVCWGRNSFQQADPPLLGAPYQVAPGTHHSCALAETSAVSCWGYDAQGQAEVPAGLAPHRDATPDLSDAPQAIRHQRANRYLTDEEPTDVAKLFGSLFLVSNVQIVKVTTQTGQAEVVSASGQQTPVEIRPTESNLSEAAPAGTPALIAAADPPSSLLSLSAR